MKVKEFMSQTPVCCTPETGLIAIAKEMIRHNCGVLPVVGDTGTRKPLLGIVTDRDIVCRSLGRDEDPLGMTVGQVMTREVVSAKPNEDLMECRRRMEQSLIRRLPVVDDSGAVVGMLTQADIARSDSDATSGAFLNKLSQPGGAPSAVAARG